jgi:hypothetical protein
MGAKDGGFFLADLFADAGRRFFEVARGGSAGLLEPPHFVGEVVGVDEGGLAPRQDGVDAVGTSHGHAGRDWNTFTHDTSPRRVKDRIDGREGRRPTDAVVTQRRARRKK